jgi:hypothetical protein
MITPAVVIYFPSLYFLSEITANICFFSSLCPTHILFYRPNNLQIITITTAINKTQTKARYSGIHLYSQLREKPKQEDPKFEAR